MMCIHSDCHCQIPHENRYVYGEAYALENFYLFHVTNSFGKPHMPNKHFIINEVLFEFNLFEINSSIIIAKRHRADYLGHSGIPINFPNEDERLLAATLHSLFCPVHGHNPDKSLPCHWNNSSWTDLGRLDWIERAQTVMRVSEDLGVSVTTAAAILNSAWET